MGARWTPRCLLISIASLLIAACSNGTGSVEERPPTQSAQEGFTLGGTVTGLSGQGLVLQNNGSSDLAVSANGTFTFPGSLTGAYSVTVRSQPSGQVCAVSNGSGTLAANVTNIAVTCNNASGAFVVRGTVSGLAAQGLVLQNNGTDDLAVTANGGFSFPITLPTSAPYNVTVRTQPTSPAQTCSVTNGSGVMGSGDVTNVAVTCSAGSISIGGTVTGLMLGSSVGLTNNGSDNTTVTANGPFVFPRGVAIGSAYFVTVSSNPTNPPQSCTVTDGSGTASSVNVTNIVVTCSTNYTVGGVITDLLGSGLTLALNGANDLTIPAGMRNFAFGAFLSSGSAYAVSIRTQPSNPAQVCTLTNATGVVANGNVTTVAVTCAIPTQAIGGRVSGLRGAGLVLQNNALDDLPIQSDGDFTFATRLQLGATYNVTVRTQPSAPLQECTVANNTGTVSGDVRNIRVTCATRTFRVLVNVTGLLGSGLRLRNNGGGPHLDVTADGVHAFTEQVANGAQYNVAVDRQPSGPTQSCTSTNASGTMSVQDVTVNLTCTTSSFTVRGTVTNLVGSGLVLQNNAQTLPVSTSAFEFPAIPSGSAYNVTVTTQPSSPVQSCTVANGSGTVGGANIENVRVDCVTTEFTIGGQVSSLAGAGLVLQNNGGDNLAIAANGPFTFADSLPQGASYNVTVATPPANPAQECAVANGTGAVGASNVGNVQVACTTVEFTVGGNVTGLAGSSLPGSAVILQNNGSDTIEVAADGAFIFPVRVRTGQPYNVTVQTQPSNPTRLCSVVNGSGVMGSGAVNTVQVFCIAIPIFP